MASYLERIPKEKGQIDTLKLNRNEALYELGIIYKEQFKNKQLAIERLERVVALNPRENLVLPINWHLYQVYKGLGEIDKANIYKNIILTEYANTPFAQRIRNPDQEIEEDVKLNEIEVLYKERFIIYIRKAHMKKW